MVKIPPEPATAIVGSLSRHERLAAADGTQGDMTDTMQILPTDHAITIRVFVDRTLVEVPFRTDPAFRRPPSSCHSLSLLPMVAQD